MARSSRRPREAHGAGVALPSPRLLGELAEELGGAVDPGAEAIAIRALAPVDVAREADLAPFLARRFLGAARAAPGPILVDAALAPLLAAGRRWIHPHAAFALARLLALAAPPPLPDARGAAHVDPGADVDPTASIGPGAVILAGASIGPFARVEPNAVIYGGSRIGARVSIGAGAVVGRPGFGWTAAPDGSVVRVPQLGGVVVEDDAEIGALATVDAGTLSPTVICRGAKLDAHVHVGHNAIVGEGAMIAAQAGFAGSARIGAGVLVGGQAGVADHVSVGAGAKIAAKSGVIGDIANGASVAGYPAVDRSRWLRATARALSPRAPAEERRGPERKR